MARRLLLLAFAAGVTAALVAGRRRLSAGDPSRNGGSQQRADRLRREVEQARERLRADIESARER